MEENVDQPLKEEGSPFGNWKRFYALVLGFLLFQIILYYLISIAY